ncbi:MAG: hypothetical protein AAF927_32080 [Bacteroidota bacterium]
MRTLLLSCLLFWPSLWQMSYAAMEAKQEAEPPYLIWIYDSAGNRIANGFFYSQTDSSLTISNKSKAALRGRKQSFAFDSIGFIEYRSLREMDQQSNIGATWTFLISGCVTWIAGLLSHGPFEVYGEMKELFLLLFLIQLTIFVVFPITIIARFYLRYGRKFRKKLTPDGRRIDLSPLAEEQ